jgi:hypothetical protein
MVGWFRRGSVKQQPVLSSASGIGTGVIGESAAVVAPGFQAASADARLYSASSHDSTCAAPVVSNIDRRVRGCARLPCVLWDLVTSDVHRRTKSSNRFESTACVTVRLVSVLHSWLHA